MNEFLVAVILLSGLMILVGCCFGWQLLLQNGRMLARLEELEKRLDELKFGEVDEPGSLLNGQAAERRDASPVLEPEPPLNPSLSLNRGEKEVQDPAARFSNRSLASSKLNRDGLKAGAPAPNFRLPRLDGSELSLEDLRGHRVLLVFSDPHCGPCQVLAPHLEKFHRERSDIQMVMISRGNPKENRAKVKEHSLTFSILLQQQWEISRRYAMFATPIAYLINEAGIITHDVAVGVEPTLALLRGQAAAKEDTDTRSTNSVNHR